MPAFDPTASARLWLDYTVLGDAHSFQVRYTTVAAAASAADILRQVLVANPNCFSDSASFVAARVADVGTNISNPIPWDVFTGTGGEGLAPSLRPRYVNQTARSSNGAQARYFFYGFLPSLGDVASDYRFTVGEDANVDAFFGDLKDALEETNAVTIGLQAPVWKAYVNCGWSAYWQKKARGG